MSHSASGVGRSAWSRSDSSLPTPTVSALDERPISTGRHDRPSSVECRGWADCRGWQHANTVMTVNRRSMPWNHLRSVGQRVHRKVGESGWAYTTQLALQRVVPGWLFDVSAVWLCERPLDENVPAVVDDDFRLAAAAEVGELVAQGALREKLAPGVSDSSVIVWVLQRGSDVVGSFLMKEGSYRPFHFLHLELADDEVVGDEVFVVPEGRGQGLGPHMNRLVAHHYRQQGKRRVVSVVDVLNRNALRMDQKVGYRRLGLVVLVRLGGLTLVVDRGHPRLGRFTAKRPYVLRSTDPEGEERTP